MKRRFLTSVLLSGIFLAGVIGAARARGRQTAPPTAPPFDGMSAPEPVPPAAAKTAPPLPQGPAPDLDLLFTNQVIGWIEPCG